MRKQYTNGYTEFTMNWNIVRLSTILLDVSTLKKLYNGMKLPREH